MTNRRLSSSAQLTDRISVGVLTQVIRRDLVEEVVAECGRKEKRSRLLPAHVVVSAKAMKR
ncbi:transposase domain-containing protein [Actinopolymorpha pittospori]|uniref:transposase domain-containing protein n=1 Tax=Actinopolymorpha pittospori TaxID=648752 RepID=UPI00178A2C75